RDDGRRTPPPLSGAAAQRGPPQGHRDENGVRGYRRDDRLQLLLRLLPQLSRPLSRKPYGNPAPAAGAGEGLTSRPPVARVRRAAGPAPSRLPDATGHSSARRG